MRKKIDYTKLVISILICNAAGIIGSFFTSPTIPGWYASLVKPGFNPPGWIFGPVWILLYIMMGISLYLIWREGLEKKQNRIAAIMFGIQLILNSAWSIIFFGLHAPLVAFIEIIILWIAIAATIILFYRISKKASYLLLPYILWVSFAAVLNFAIFYLN